MKVTAEQIENVLSLRGQRANQILQLMTVEEKDRLGTMPRARVHEYKEAMTAKYNTAVEVIEREWA